VRFLHTSDLHLNALRTRFDRYAERANAMLDEIDRIALEKEVNFILVSGDIFDRPDLTNVDRQLLSDWLARTPKPVVMISGNHDARSGAIGDTCLSYLSVLSLERHLIYDGDPTIKTWWAKYGEGVGEGVILLLLPWHGWPHHEFFGIVTSMLEEVDTRFSQNDRPPVVVVSHEAFAGCFADNGQPVLKSGQPKIPAELSVSYWALGDIHLHQKLGESVYYSGAPHQIDFGEKPGKGCLIVDTDTLPEIEFVPIESFPLVTLTEAPAIWPPFCRFMPAEHTPPPPGVEYVAPSGIMKHEASRAELVGTLDGLENVLSKTSLPQTHYARALELAKAMLSEI
jgi:exonuclease SbcD